MREMLFAMAAVVSDNDKKTRHGQIELAGWVPREKNWGRREKQRRKGIAWATSARVMTVASFGTRA
jgi:hypothetical protein